VDSKDIEEDEEEVTTPITQAMADKNFTSLVGKITKLKGGSNYRTWAKDMEMCLLRDKCWDVVTSVLPAEQARTEEWKTKDNWARGEIHLCCEADVQDIIIDSEHAHESWTLLQNEYCKKGELKVRRLKKEFSSVSMTESSCGEYMKRVRKIVSELKECGEKIKDEDVAYTILLGFGEKYSLLVVTLTNMATLENPLSIARVSEQILTEELRLNQFGVQQKQDPNVNNLLAYKADTAYKEEQSALVARTSPVSYRQTPYNLRSTYKGREGYPYGGGHTRFGSSQATSATVQQTQKPKDLADPDTTHTWTQQQRIWSSQGNVFRNLPWGSAPWQPRSFMMSTQGHTPTIEDFQHREERQCYTCGLWGHTRKNCWQKHPELHPANK